MRKIAQLWKLVQESHAEPLKGEAGKPIALQQGQAGAMFLGHSSFLLGIGGKNVLVDPVFATRLVLLRRQRRAGVEIEDLPAIDVVLVTHAHMDHLNRPTLRKVARATKRLTGKGPIAIVPDGVADLLKGLGFSEVRTLKWWESNQVAGLKVTLTPCQHWGARMFKDTHRLFGGFVVEGGGQTIYHSGDTAYFAGFAEIGRRLGPIDVALLPIGAYFPDSYRAVHTSPEEGLQGFVDVGARWMVPMHFGTFKLGREPFDEPPIRLMAEARRRGIEDRVRVLGEGETLVVGGDEDEVKAGDVLYAGASNSA
ncbi:MBL fold metallo-hydrolase [Granulicella tundricola]|uniref:Metallo-beta-lactamase family protein n=1 Tax=Granulicella tundricola (strain ATCC BAA-1859 / DSM 23138 / MP5ACTX9) TaxID=1198114 RepID=E8X241_GRATM|nr:MBL fold metallo-hydrolase [Granulicella tundricola]ADW70284.1 metallo-beta-lactamase family protein [Granulicella tundricola MP5ACTX9]